MEQHTHEPQPPVIIPPVIRHDGWTGEKMAIFCETLAETAVVAEACDQACMGISGAYAARRRHPVFAAAWDAALTIAREPLADTLLARSMEGNAEQIWRDGVVVGERHLLDNKLGLQILRRLDRLAEGTRKNAVSPDPAANARPERKTASPSSQPFDWNLAIDALRTGDNELCGRALALIKGHEMEEVEGDPNLPLSEGENDTLDLTDRCWFDANEQIWMTDFPPPAGFRRYESCDYGDLEDPEPYVRNCTPEETAILEAAPPNGLRTKTCATNGSLSCRATCRNRG